MASGSRSTGRKKYVSDLQVYRAAHRNRTDDLRITRGMVACNTDATCADSTARCTDGTLCPGLLPLSVPRGVPHPQRDRGHHPADWRGGLAEARLDPVLSGHDDLQNAF